MPNLKDFLTFLAANALGFSSASLCYVLGIHFGLISPTELDSERIRLFFGGIMMTWMVCALFSLGFFFLKGNMRWVFVLAPAVLPALYGFRVLFLLSP